jgi:hypothetical protein
MIQATVPVPKRSKKDFDRGSRALLQVSSIVNGSNSNTNSNKSHNSRELASSASLFRDPCCHRDFSLNLNQVWSKFSSRRWFMLKEEILMQIAHIDQILGDLQLPSRHDIAEGEKVIHEVRAFL